MAPTAATMRILVRPDVVMKALQELQGLGPFFHVDWRAEIPKALRIPKMGTRFRLPVLAAPGLEGTRNHLPSFAEGGPCDATLRSSVP